MSSATWAPIKAQNAWVEFAANLEWRSAHRWAMYKWTAPDLPSFHGQSEPKMSLSKAPMPGMSWICVKFFKMLLTDFHSQWLFVLFISLILLHSLVSLPYVALRADDTWDEYHRVRSKKRLGWVLGVWYCWWFRNPAITTWDVYTLWMMG